MIYASEISKDLYKYIQKREYRAEIHSIFKNTINVLTNNGNFISIYTNDKPMSPKSIKLKEHFNLMDLNIKNGEQGVFKKNFYISTNFSINYKNSMIWDNSISLDFSIDSYNNVIDKLDLIKQFILKKGNKNGIFPLMKFLPENLFTLPTDKIEDKKELFIKDRFISFLECFRLNDKTKINNISKKIIGYGPGLTPSMDDFISGLMIANIYLSYFLKLDIETAFKLNKAIVSNIDNITTLVSEEMLKLSSVGETNQDIRELMLFLVGKSNQSKANNTINKVLEFGHSSGTDILCGIYVGSYFILNNFMYKPSFL